MSLPQAFFDALDETPRDPKGVLTRTAEGEVRVVPISAFAALGRTEFRSRPRLERAQNRTALLGHLLELEREREERDERRPD
ncbi:MAG: hypothetical protein H0V79_07765 [Actinobacteria bacterium]|nr:hypothetical protein [Actinomycetota bacterium]